MLQVSEKLKCVCTLTNCNHFESPSVIVIGEPNSGKSSLIDSLVGHPFLPVGSNNVTRCPLEINVVKKQNDDLSDWAVFQNSPDCLITDFNRVRQIIDIEMHKKTGPEKPISTDPISLRIHSSKALNVRLVDLPGLMRIPENKQEEDIGVILKNIVLKYISNINSIILIVISANQDLLSNEGLKLSKQVDPFGTRSLLVLSKLDLVNPSDLEIHGILGGRIKPVKLNIIGIINKFQNDSRESIFKSVKDEALLLKKNFPHIAHKHGIKQLNISIYRLFLYHVNEFLPKLKDNVTASFRRYRQILANYGQPTEDHYKTILELVSNFTLGYTSTILGPHKDFDTAELTGGARINYIFREIFSQALRDINPLSGFSRSTLLTAVRNASGVKSSIFVPDRCFELLVKKQIKKLESPSLRCAELVYDEMEKHIDNCGQTISSQLRRFPKLRQQIISTLLEMLKTRIELTNEMIHQLIDIHTAYINTAHPDFIIQNKQFNTTHSNELCTPDYHLQNRNFIAYEGGEPFCNESNGDYLSYQCLIIERLILSYFNIVRTAIEDTVPKTIMHFLVNSLTENLQSELVAKIFINGIPDKELIKESSDIVQDRKQTVEIMQSHEQAINIISEINKIIK